MPKRASCKPENKKTRTKRGGSQADPKALATRKQVGAFEAVNDLSDQEIEEALVTGDHVGLLSDYFGENDYRELSDLAKEAARRQRRGGPRVLILPGIMGSKLGFKRSLWFDDVIWLDLIDIAAGELSKLKFQGGRDKIASLGVFLLFYLKLKLRLATKGFDVSFHPFDWRRSLEDLGDQLAQTLQKETAKEVHLVCHSMGGLVARMALAKGAPKVKNAIMLGTPNHGSFSPVMAFRGTHETARKVAFIDQFHTAEEHAKDLFQTFPGLHEMLPWPEVFKGIDLFSKQNWPQDDLVPNQSSLTAARKIQLSLSTGHESLTLIAGINKETIVDAELVGDKFLYTLSAAGDGTVPLRSARMDGVTTYYVEEEHGSLPSNAMVADAVGDLINKGSTSVLSTDWPKSRTVPQRTASESEITTGIYGGVRGRHLSLDEKRDFLRPFLSTGATGHDGQSTPRDQSIAVTGSTPPRFDGMVIGRRRQRTVNITLAHGSVTEVDARACVVGIFQNVTPSGAARAIDKALGGTVSELVMRHMFDGRIGDITTVPAAPPTSTRRDGSICGPRTHRPVR